MVEFEIPNRWIEFRLSIEYDDQLTIKAQRDDGNTKSWRTEQFTLPTPALLSTSLFLSDPQTKSDIANFVKEYASLLPLRTMPEIGEQTVPLPLFISPPPGLGALNWEEAFIKMFIDQGEKRVSCIRLAPPGIEKDRSRPIAGLPLFLLGIGTSGEIAVSRLRQMEWYLSDDKISTYGIRSTTVHIETAKEQLMQGPHIIITGPDIIDRIIKNTRSLGEKRPRLFIVLDEGRGQLSSGLKMDSLSVILPRGSALLWVTAGIQQNRDYFLANFFRCLVHDNPLHEAVKRAADYPSPETSQLKYYLLADSFTNNALRMIDAYAYIEEKISTFESAAYLGNIDSFLEKIMPDVSENFITQLHAAKAAAEPLNESVAYFRNMPLEFLHEGTGLEPLAESIKKIEIAENAHPKIEIELLKIAKDENTPAIFRKHQERRVDIGLQRRAYSPLVTPANPEPNALYVQKNVALRRSTKYRLLVRIGRHFAKSLLTGEIPSIDPLLPEVKAGEGHTIDVVVYSLDFSVEGSKIKSIYLPPFGGSDIAVFDVIAPEKCGDARLRVALYHRNHLIQMFRLETDILEDEMVSDKGLMVKLEFSRTSNFSNIDQLGKRFLSASYNDDGNGRTHTFMFKKEGTTHSVRINENMIKDQMTRFRKVLTEAVHEGFSSESGSVADPSPEFHRIISQLMQIGRDLRRTVWRKTTIREDFKAIAGSSNEIIQVVRAEPNFAFPWTIIYDYSLPPKIAGEPPPQVCMGVNCSHGPGDQAYCLKGFWGFRHFVEELVAGSDTEQNETSKIFCASNKLAIGLAVDLESKNLVDKLNQSVGPDLWKEFPIPGESIIDTIWKDNFRPPILIVLGHLQTTKKSGEPEAPRIKLRPADQWLLADSISDRAQDVSRWQAPHSLVLLMACGSGATELETINNFVLAFQDAGAKAVIGTETLLTQKLAERFAGDVAVSVWHGMKLGQALTEVRRNLLYGGNPLAFNFTAIGDADLEVIKE